MREINKIIVHCSAHRTASFDDVLNWHTLEKPDGNGWDDIGYHWAVCYGGQEYEGRPLQIQGAHCKGYNEDSIGACLLGDKEFSFNQLETLRMQIYAWEVMIGHKLEVFAHYELNNTGKTCPNIDADLLRKFIRCERYLGRVEIYKLMGV